ncbi:MAG TPA: hypothetical protein ENJ80_07425 [Gammaproteobacteria bacterium]|nr:hypothetical protein [Gammaproteobacteria bacterium]
MKQHINASQDARTGSYLLHIYRSSGENALLVGTLERLGDNRKTAFSSPEELLQLLGAGDSGPEQGSR